MKPKATPKPKTRFSVRKGQIDVTLGKTEFTKRLMARFYDPAFDKVRAQVKDVIDVAWDGYHESRKSPRTRKAGPEFADPNFDLPVEWLATRKQIRQAQTRYEDPKSKSRILLICASARNDQTCPGEMSKTYRLVKIAEKVVRAAGGFEAEILDLSRLTAEYGRVIYPCKACVSTAMPLCHWPCSCYPNHSLGQVNDWMNEIYPKWVAAHGILIVSPVNWYQAPTVLKSMIDRLVCADGGNPDFTSTGGKDPKRAKELELQGWNYPRHLAGRAYSVVVHGDTDGVETLRGALVGWLNDMKLIQASATAVVGKYIGYYEPYATSHEALDAAEDVQIEVQQAAQSLVQMVRLIRSGQYQRPDQGLEPPNPK